MVGQDSAEEHEEEGGDGVGKADEPEEESRVGQAIDEVPLRHRLHPRTDVREELRHPEAAVVGLLKALEHGRMIARGSSERAIRSAVRSAAILAAGTTASCRRGWVWRPDAAPPARW